MAAYLIIEIEIKDEARYSQYIQKVRDVIIRYGGKYLARGGEIISLSRDWSPQRIVLVEFDSKKQVLTCLSSSEYQEIAHLRKSSTISKAVIVEGCSE